MYISDLLKGSYTANFAVINERVGNKSPRLVVTSP